MSEKSAERRSVFVLAGSFASDTDERRRQRSTPAVLRTAICSSMWETDSSLSPLFAIQPGSLLEVMSHPQLFFPSTSFFFSFRPQRHGNTVGKARRWEKRGADEVMGEKKGRKRRRRTVMWLWTVFCFWRNKKKKENLHGFCSAHLSRRPLVAPRESGTGGEWGRACDGPFCPICPSAASP